MRKPDFKQQKDRLFCGLDADIAAKVLDDRAFIIVMRRCRGVTLRDLGDKFEITGEYVRTIERKALRKIAKHRRQQEGHHEDHSAKP